MVGYIVKALSPGGTPTRYLVWVSVILFLQTAASVLPSPLFYESSLNLPQILLVVVVVLCLTVNFLKNDKQRILAAYTMYIVGLLISTVTIALGITPLSGIIFMVTWSMTLFVAERREYISFNLVTAFMVLMLLSTVLMLMYEPTFSVNQNYTVLVVGAVITSINIYLVYADFGLEKNFYQESRKIFSNLEALSNKMSEILSSKGELKHLLGLVSQECIPLLDIEDCVIYLYDEEKDKLIQVAAYGNKKSDDDQVINPIELSPGIGVVGNCFVQKKPILVQDTSTYSDYVVDDVQRNSELSVPIMSGGQVVGVIDSEHSQRGFFKERHVQAFTIIASFCGVKITEYNARESMKQAKIAIEETEKYKELDELKNRFITNISHDLKTPLSLIKGPAVQISEQSNGLKVRKLAQYILKNADHLLNVVNQLLQLNRIDKGLNELYVEEINIATLIQKIVSQYEGLVISKNINLIVKSEPLLISTDAFRLEQIIHNLLHNAFRYSPVNSEIRLSASLEVGNILKIVVADNGSGIADDVKDKIFDRFFKVDVNNHEGTGIGLSLVKEYAKAIGGNIQLDNSYTSGARFILTLPMENIANQISNEIENEPIDDSNASKPVMVIVEDHPDLNNFIYDFFENKFQCFQSFDGVDGLKRIKELEPDIIVTDLMMPHMDGKTMIKAIKQEEKLAHIPVVVLTAKGQTDSKINLYSIGAENYLVKPFDIIELDAIVNSILTQRQRLKSLFRENYFVPDEELNPVVNEHKNALVQAAISLIHEHLDDSQFSTTQLIQHLNLGRNKLQQEIKENTGLTPVEFIRSTRLIEAKQRLENSNSSVSEVAYSVGFNNLSYFTRSFKAEFGILPTEIRNKFFH